MRRMLLTMRALTQAARAICYATGAAIDRSHRGKDDAARKAADERASLLTPVAKAFSTDIGIEVASLGVQVHGGMGFIEETGAAQHYRDARIAQIYEGTNGIQAIDLVTRKMPLMGGAVMRGYLDELRGSSRAVKATNDPAFGATGARLGEAVDSLDRATAWLLAQARQSPDAALAGATPYLRLFASPRAAACSRRKRSPRRRGGGAAPAASRSRASLRRISPCRRAGSKTPSRKARSRFQTRRCAARLEEQQ